MLADAPSVLVDAGVIAGAITAVITALALVVRSRPARWLGRTLVARPLDRWARGLIAEVVDERLDARPLTNGWGARAVQCIAEATGAAVDPPHQS